MVLALLSVEAPVIALLLTGNAGFSYRDKNHCDLLKTAAVFTSAFFASASILLCEHWIRYCAKRIKPPLDHGRHAHPKGFP